MAVEVVKDKFPQGLKAVNEIVIEALNMVFALFVLLIGGFIAAELAWTQMNASLQIPIGYLYAVMPVSGLCILFYCTYNIYQTVQTRKKG